MDLRATQRGFKPLLQVKTFARLVLAFHTREFQLSPRLGMPLAFLLQLLDQMRLLARRRGLAARR